MINNRMTNYVFQVLEKEGVPTHYVEELSDRETAVKKVEIVPLEVIVRNVAAGSFLRDWESKKEENCSHRLWNSVIKTMISEIR